MVKIFLKFEITTDYFWADDERTIVEGRTFNPQEFPDRVTLFQTNETFQLRVTISNFEIHIKIYQGYGS